MIYEVEVDLLDIKHKTRIKTHCMPRHLGGQQRELRIFEHFPEVIMNCSNKIGRLTDWIIGR